LIGLKFPYLTILLSIIIIIKVGKVNEIKNCKTPITRFLDRMSNLFFNRIQKFE